MTTLKNSPGVSPGGCWCLELTDALLLNTKDAMIYVNGTVTYALLLDRFFKS